MMYVIIEYGGVLKMVVPRNHPFKKDFIGCSMK